jgi:hypothetical protein
MRALEVELLVIAGLLLLQGGTPVRAMDDDEAKETASISSTAGCVLDPSIPAELARWAGAQPLCAGFLNASAPPYSAAGDGVTDDSSALQAALDDAYANRMAVLLQSGKTFLVTRQLQAVQPGPPKQSRAFGYQLVGTRGGPPPVLKVQDNANLAHFPAFYTSALPQAYEARPAIRFALNQSNPDNPPKHPSPQVNNPGSHYSALLRNVAIDLGHNPKLSGVSMIGAQLCALEDVSVRGAAFTAGVVGLPGSGAYAANIHVTGGLFAVWQQQHRPNPLVVGLVALNQSVAGVLLEDARGPLVLSGFVIRSSLSTAGVIEHKDKSLGSSAAGDVGLAMEDGILALSMRNSTAIVNSGGTDLSLRNVFVEADVAVTVGSHAVLRSTPNVPKHIAEFAYSEASIAFDNGVNVSASAGLTGVPRLNLLSAPVAVPPSDAVFSEKHSWSTEWAESVAWSADRASMLDAVRDCGATPDWVDSTDDDGAAITKCLARAPSTGVVFVPRY